MEAVRPPRSGPSCGILIGGFLLAALSPVGWWWWHARRQAEISVNERKASHVVKVLANLEAEFRANAPDRNGVQDFWTGDIAGLLKLVGPTGKSGVNDSELARADPPRPDARPYFGYWFVPIATDEMGKPYRQNGGNFHPSAFGWCAYPAEYGVSGYSTYIINEGNSPFKRDTKGAPVPNWPTDENLKREWAKYQ